MGALDSIVEEDTIDDPVDKLATDDPPDLVSLYFPQLKILLNSFLNCLKCYKHHRDRKILIAYISEVGSLYIYPRE